MTYVFSKLLQPNVNYLKNVHWYRLQYTLKNKSVDFKPQDLEVLYKSKHFLIVNKPYDLIMYEYGKNADKIPSLYDYLKEKFPMYYDPRLRGGFHVLHRLDSVTSGCLCVPLNYFSQRLGVEAFENGRANKNYLALVYGRLDEKVLDLYGVKKEKNANESNSFTIDVKTGEDLRRFKFSRCTEFDKNGNKLDYCVYTTNSITNIKVLEYGTYKGKDCTKLLIQPITGRRHQIRVHLTYLDHPIVGDLTYGLDDFDAYRTMLHSYQLNMELDTKKKIRAIAADPFISEIDPDLKSIEIVNKI
jgi:23S rRNA-/tRNA-specific pseudouridylate synthase